MPLYFLEKIYEFSNFYFYMINAYEHFYEPYGVWTLAHACSLIYEVHVQELLRPQHMHIKFASERLRQTLIHWRIFCCLLYTYKSYQLHILVYTMRRRETAISHALWTPRIIHTTAPRNQLLRATHQDS